MTLNSYPFEGQTTTEYEYSKLMREMQDTGVAANVTSTSLQVVPTPSSSLSSTVKAGRAIVRGHMFEALDDTVRTHSAVASGTGGQRIDAIVMRLDPDSNQISLVVKEGTATTAPSMEQTSAGIWEEMLAQCTVDSAGNVSAVDKRRFVGGRVGVWATATRPAGRPYTTYGYNLTLGDYEYWTPSGWVQLRGGDTGWVAITGPVAALSGDTLMSARMRQNGDAAEVYLNLKLSGGPIAVNTSGNIANRSVYQLPSSYRPSSPLGAGMQCAATGRLLSGYCSPSGLVQITATYPDHDFADDEDISLFGHWFCK